MLGIVSATVFLLFALVLLRKCYLLLLDILPGGIKMGIVRRVAHLSGLLLWFFTGVVALTYSLTQFTEKAILALQ